MIRRYRPALWLVPLAAVFSVGCNTPPPLYDWGIYENLLWEGYRAEGGDADPSSQLARLEADVQRIVTSGKRVPPGVHAHIGFLRFSTGDLDAAREHFIEERALFPESSVFVDGLLARMERDDALPEVPTGIQPDSTSNADDEAAEAAVDVEEQGAPQADPADPAEIEPADIAPEAAETETAHP